MRMTHLMQKLHEMSDREKPMVNPFSVPTHIADQAQGFFATCSISII